MTTPDIRLLALDLDGTVFTDDKKITDITRAALRKAIEKGVVVMPATGRPLSGLPEQFVEMEGVNYALTSNGAAIWDLQKNEKIVSLPFTTQQTLQAMHLMKPFECMLDVYFDGKVYTSPENIGNVERFAPPEMVEYVKKTRIPVENLEQYIQENGLCAEKVTMFFFDPVQQQQATELAKRQDWIEASSSVANNLELNAAGVNKGEGLRRLAEFFGITIEQVMACGDGGNDIAMLKAAGLGVAMENASEQVKAAADVVTLSNQQNGVAHAIETYILK